jgi:fatty acid desaturase
MYGDRVLLCRIVFLGLADEAEKRAFRLACRQPFYMSMTPVLWWTSGVGGVHVKIPKRLNAALDWAAAKTRSILIVLLLVVAAVGALWMPTLAAFAVGLGIGGVAVHIRMTAKVDRLRADLDDLLRENGALRHEKTVIARATVASESVLTQKMPSIPDVDDE